VVGITGYVLFGACVCDNISVSFGPSVLVAIGQGFVVTSVCCGEWSGQLPIRERRAEERRGQERTREDRRGQERRAIHHFVAETHYCCRLNTCLFRLVVCGVVCVACRVCDALLAGAESAYLPFAMLFYTKNDIILPRQARDKQAQGRHSKRDDAFSVVRAVSRCDSRYRMAALPARDRGGRAASRKRSGPVRCRHSRSG
jgi:hypothetical protein